jgi:membrane protease YdiL (CAAX protease family)
LWIKREELYSYHIIGQIRIFNNIAVGALLGLMMALVTIIKLDVNEIIDITSLDQSLGLVLWVSLAFKVIETAMIEELLFRGILLGYLDTYMPMRWMANIVQSAVFCLAHLPRHWDSGWEAFMLVIVFGLLAGYMVQRQRNIIGSVVAHILINSLPLVSLLLML